jgi:hypothetical protein
MTSNHRKDVIALLAIGAAAAALIAWLIARSARGGTSDPLAAVPVDSFLVATLDVRALATSPIGEAIAGDGGVRTGAMFGVDSIEATCGFDPLPHVRAIALTVPEGETHGDLGFAATGDLASSSLETCAKTVIAKRGGHATTRQSGSFTVISSDDARSGALAFRDGGPFLVGNGAWLEAMIDATEGRRPSMASAGSDAHHVLRADLATLEPGDSAVVASAIVPRELRDRVRSEMEIAGDEAKLGPSIDGVLAVASVGLALHAGRAGEDTRVTLEIRCDGDAAEAACEKVEKMVLHFRLGWSGDLRLRLVGLGPLIDGLETQRTGATLLVRTHARASDLAHALSRIASMQAHAKPGSPSTGPEQPDEVVKPAPSPSSRP